MLNWSVWLRTTKSKILVRQTRLVAAFHVLQVWLGSHARPLPFPVSVLLSCSDRRLSRLTCPLFSCRLFGIQLSGVIRQSRLTGRRNANFAEVKYFLCQCQNTCPHSNVFLSNWSVTTISRRVRSRSKPEVDTHWGHGCRRLCFDFEDRLILVDSTCVATRVFSGISLKNLCLEATVRKCGSKIRQKLHKIPTRVTDCTVETGVRF